MKTVKLIVLFMAVGNTSFAEVLPDAYNGIFIGGKIVEEKIGKNYFDIPDIEKIKQTEKENQEYPLSRQLGSIVENFRVLERFA